ncbi:MAG: segregation/condensation protein A [Verrucomicrobiota bacterium]
MENDYRVELDIFEGPLDLLLYLVKKDEVDIHEISIERIAKQYLEYIDTFKMLNIELASEFIVMAANLIYIKSRMLLPKHVQTPEEEADEDDPRWELIRQLIEYKKFKDAAGFLQERHEQQQRMFASQPELPDIPQDPAPLPDSVGIFDLIRAFQNVLKRFEESESIGEIFDDRLTVSDQIDFLIDKVPPGDAISFSKLFAHAGSKSEVVVTFVALLELIRMKEFRVRQEQSLGEIELERLVRADNAGIAPTLA